MPKKEESSSSTSTTSDDDDDEEDDYEYDGLSEESILDDEEEEQVKNNSNKNKFGGGATGGFGGGFNPFAQVSVAKSPHPFTARDKDLVLDSKTGEPLCHLPPFDPMTLPVPSTVLWVGCSNSGKTTGGTYVMSTYGARHDRVCALRGVANNDYYYINPLYDYEDDGSGNSASKLEFIYETQKKRAKKARKDPTYDPTLCLILDDLGDCKEITKNKTLKRILQKGRHEKISLFVHVQYILDLVPCLRRNFTHIVIFQEDSPTGRKQFWNNYMAFVPSFKQFNVILNNCCNNYGALVFAKDVKSSKIEDRLFNLRVPPELFEEYEEVIGNNRVKKKRLNIKFEVGSQRYRDYALNHTPPPKTNEEQVVELKEAKEEKKKTIPSRSVKPKLTPQQDLLSFPVIQ
jgi:Poxvirus A32 protein